MIGRFFCILLVLSTIAFAKGNGFNVLTKGKYLLSYEQAYDDVWTLGEAKSTKTMCKVRIDIQHMLLESGSCDVEKVSFYTKDSMWLGNLHHGLFDDEESFDAGYSYKGVYYSFNIKDAAYMKASFTFSSKDASEDNLWRISCPRGKEKGINGAFAVCYSPWICKKDEFSLDEQTCAKLPKNGKRLEKEGWSCLDGYELYDDQDTIYCYKPYKCGKDEYSVNEQLCEKLPPHTKRLEEDGYVCIDGYAMVEKEDFSYCEKKVMCKKTDLYVEKENKCYALPEHAIWRENASDSTDFECDEGFKLNDDTFVCQKRVVECDSEYVVSNDEFSCVEIPADSHKEDEYRWACNDGFGEKDGECFQRAICDSSEYYLDEFTCAMLPGNSHATNYGWECNEGYYSNGNWCEKIPPNAHRNKYGNGWDCNYGYKENDGRCEKLAVCSNGQYKLTDFDCADLPEHAHEVSGYTWECDYGYVNMSDNVCEEIPVCGENEVLNKDYNRCDKIPWHSKKYDEESWVCNENYHEEYEDGERICKHDPFNIYNNLSLELAGVIGTQVLEDNSYTNNYDYDDPVFIEDEFGLEWLFGEKFSFGPAISIARVFEKRPDELTYYSTRMNYAVVLAFGSGSVQYYGRPFISTNVATTVEYKSETRGTMDYSIPAAVGGLELGIRLGDSYTNNIAFDLYFGMMANPFKDDLVDDEYVLYFGARLIAF